LLNPHHAPLITAITQGFLQEKRIGIELVQDLGSLEGCIQAYAGVVDLALTNEAQLLIQNSKGLGLTPVMSLIDEPLEVCVSSVPLTELKGKRIGHSAVSGSQLLC
jgi:ABC-type nitrate/sulfonate/bicarbonate transport system substrate-binding protein